MKKIAIILGVVLILGLVLAGCSQKLPEPSYASAMAEDILTGINEGNYAKVSKTFDQTMKKNLNETAFKNMQSLLKSKLGDYVSKEFWKVEQKGGLTIVDYKAKFTKEANVTVRVVFKEMGTQVQVSGLWFDAPQLR